MNGDEWTRLIDEALALNTRLVAIAAKASFDEAHRIQCILSRGYARSARRWRGYFYAIRHTPAWWNWRIPEE